ncbi:MAG: AAA family ATPase [Candidatus Saccharimonadales bacterium]
MTSIFVHSQLQGTIDGLKDYLPHALIMSGRKGVGLNALAEHIASQRIAHHSSLRPEMLTKTSAIPQISVDRIRELYEDTRTKHETGRIIIIERADAMTKAAQNAFLKLLEEPNSSTWFILTTTRPDQLLPTIHSRAQHLHVPPISNGQTLALMDQLAVPETKKQQLLFIAQGLPAELVKLTRDDLYFDLAVARMQLVKGLLAPTSYERLAVVLSLKLDRGQTLQLIEATINVLLAKLDKATIAKLSLFEDAYRRIEAGGNIKLQLAKAVL